MSEIETPLSFEVGDRITFHAITRWSGKPATRTVKSIDSCGRPTVGYGGWAHFVVALKEIISVEKRP